MIHALYAHLLQSTLFAGAAALLAILLRKNAAHVRHRLWFIASVKFLIPFSLLFSMGGLVPRHVAAPTAQPRWIVTTQEIAAPLTAPTATVVIPEQKNYFSAIVLALWFAGFAAISISWLVRWQRVHALRKSATPVTGHFPIPILSASGVIEPGIVGIFRPVLLLPEGIESRLTPEQLDAIFVHESAHVRRRDNLTSAIHMAAQSIFWFHPLVWWIGMRLVEERERACDEEVLHRGIRPHIYAEGILEVCKLYVESPLACVSGVTGSDLKKRIEAIMKNRRVLRMNLIRKISLAAVSVAAIALPITSGVFSASPIRAQEPALAFEAASVKPADPNHHMVDFKITARRVDCLNLSLQDLIRTIYSVRYDQMLGGPSWLKDERFTIEATAGQDATRNEMLAMLRTLLEDRFKLRVHRQTKEGNVYVLTQGKGGHKLKPPADTTARPVIIMHRNTPNDQPGVSYTEEGRNATLPQLTERLEGILHAPVSDQTGITGNYDFVLDDRTLDAPIEAGPSIFESIQSELGLRLEARKGPLEFLVIDSAGKPSAN
jgi:bla regulator protein BlaR1